MTTIVRPVFLKNRLLRHRRLTPRPALPLQAALALLEILNQDILEEALATATVITTTTLLPVPPPRLRHHQRHPLPPTVSRRFKKKNRILKIP